MKPMTIQTVGDVAAEVRAALARKRVGQRAFGEAIGLSQSGVSRRLAGDIPFSLPELALAASFLDVELASLIPVEKAS